MDPFKNIIKKFFILILMVSLFGAISFIPSESKAGDEETDILIAELQECVDECPDDACATACTEVYIIRDLGLVLVDKTSF